MPVTLVEGVFDAIRATNAIPLLGSTLNVRSRLFKGILEKQSKIFLALDRDAEKKSLRVIKDMISYGIDVSKVDISDYKDVDSMTKEEFLKRREMAEPVTSDSFLMLNINAA